MAFSIQSSGDSVTFHCVFVNYTAHFLFDPINLGRRDLLTYPLEEEGVRRVGYTQPYPYS